MKLTTLFFVFILSILFVNCDNKKQTTNEKVNTVSETTLKNISELTYIEIYKILFTDSNGGFDVHGDMYGQDALSNIIILEEVSQCGKALFISNNSGEKEITVAIEAGFNLPGNPNTKMIRAYIVKPGGKISIGNSKLCYNGKEYILNRKIISAGFNNEEI